MGRFFTLLILILIVGGIIYLYPKLDWNKPVINIQLASSEVGVKPFDILLSDKGTGLKNVSVALSNKDGETVLIDKNYPPGVNADRVSINIDAKKLGIKNGPAELKVTAIDNSLLRFFSGNKTVAERKIDIDLKPPALDLMSTQNYINYGGSAMVVYKTSPDVVKSGIKIGDYFFPGYKGKFADNDVYLVFFAYPYNVPRGESIYLVAEDAAGNQKTVGVPYTLKDVVYRESKLNISDSFIENVVIPLSGETGQADHKEVFLKVNRDMRKKNEAKIRDIGSKSTDDILWQGAFHQLTNSKVEANFADHRTYIYNGEPIDQEYHLGYDLAVTKRYPIEAANSGIVAYAGDMGIYGNVVIIDHGMGVATLYGHMSSIDVKLGDRVKKKQIIGRTGQTGLAAGDHLHYGIYVNGVAVRPVEWWDDKWIKDNVLLKINQAKEEFGTKSSRNTPQQAQDQSQD
jgi:murein DD-endopeptidase MepM/ murein hydrolase activator NlpD